MQVTVLLASLARVDQLVERNLRGMGHGTGHGDRQPSWRRRLDERELWQPEAPQGGGDLPCRELSGDGITAAPHRALCHESSNQLE
ncbi:hypothetical protein Atai01_75640 [Amycolatopsis taiwanensis]|uniref:Uncharacterized protein n=1 Tax=Amycolatopsis taiwanensis TaxID=342230 RepID=A0A9W6RBJ5_9PSEU|nr:hypothetical protein Atai01_75640 [Amycolatopsis taiwanensis]